MAIAAGPANPAAVREPPPFRPLSVDQAALFDGSPHAVLALDAHFRIRYVNDAALRYRDGLTRGELIGLNLFERFPEYRDGPYHHAYLRVIRDGIREYFVQSHPQLNAWNAVHAYPCEGGVIAILEDISTQKRAEQALRQSERALAHAQEIAQIGSWTWHAQQGMTWSAQTFRILGLAPSTFAPDLELLRARFVSAAEREKFERAFEVALQTGNVMDTELCLRRFDGEVAYVHMLARVVPAEGGGAAQVFGTMQDVTDRHHAEEQRARLGEQMRQAQKLESLGVLAGGIAHDFNNLLVGMLGNASLALIDIAPDAPVRVNVQRIEQAAQRAAELTRQLLAFAGKGQYVLESVNIASVVAEMEALLRTAISRKASVQLDLPSGLPWVCVDTAQLRQVVVNLLTNASDALGSEHGMISLRVYAQAVDEQYLAGCVAGTNAAPGMFVAVEVRDSGRGMDHDTVQRVFEPFFTTKAAGRGLGLAATMGIMHSHGGAIRVESTPGSGSTFTALFPVTNAPVVTTDEHRVPRGSSGRILVVDDEPAVRLVSRALLERRGFDVVEAVDGERAIELFAADPSSFAVILLDLTMPGMGGEATFRAVRQLDDSARVVVMSGYSEREVTELFGGAGVAAYLEKPFTAEELYAKIDAVVGG